MVRSSTSRVNRVSFCKGARINEVEGDKMKTVLWIKSLISTNKTARQVYINRAVKKWKKQVGSRKEVIQNEKQRF